MTVEVKKDTNQPNPAKEQLTDKQVTTDKSQPQIPLDNPIKNIEMATTIPSPRVNEFHSDKTKRSEQKQFTYSVDKVDVSTSLPTSEELEQSLPTVMSSKIIPAKKPQTLSTVLTEQSQLKASPDTYSGDAYTQEMQGTIEQTPSNDEPAQQQFNNAYPEPNNYPRQNAPYQEFTHRQQVYPSYPAYYDANRYYQAYPSNNNAYSQQQWEQRNYQQPPVALSTAQSEAQPNTQSLYQSFDKNQSYPQYIPSQSVH
jgi:hypothetical protein